MYNIQALIKKIQEGHEFSYLYFWGHHQKKEHIIDKSCLSQWYVCSFVINDIEYKSAEHYMMAQKAKLFGDNDILKKILNACTPKEAKELGRKVQNFNAETWDSKAYNIVVEGNFEKFRQNENLKNFLLSTNKDIIVEASPYDKIWGIGLAQDDPRAQDPLSWKGKNYLGFALMQVRDVLSKEKEILS